ncbi:MAG: hypothetical protein RLZZ324_1276 [Candidatus Parcubacteria bacterium]|jgi:hypothetical protein
MGERNMMREDTWSPDESSKKKPKNEMSDAAREMFEQSYAAAQGNRPKSEPKLRAQPEATKGSIEFAPPIVQKHLNTLDNQYLESLTQEALRGRAQSDALKALGALIREAAPEGISFKEPKPAVEEPPAPAAAKPPARPVSHRLAALNRAVGFKPPSTPPRPVSSPVHKAAPKGPSPRVILSNAVAALPENHRIEIAKLIKGYANVQEAHRSKE